MTQLEPSCFFQILVSSADGIWMNAEPSRQLPRAWQACACLKIFAQYREDNLRCQLLTNRYFADMRNPEAHAGAPVSVRLRRRARFRGARHRAHLPQRPRTSSKHPGSKMELNNF